MFNRMLNHLEELLVTLLMGAATLIIFISVMHRYLAGVNIPGLQDWLIGLNFGWAQELCIIMFVWMAKFGAAYGVRTGIHVGVDVLINRMGDGMRGKFIVFGLLAGATFTGIVASLVKGLDVEEAAFLALVLDSLAIAAQFAGAWPQGLRGAGRACASSMCRPTKWRGCAGRWG